LVWGKAHNIDLYKKSGVKNKKEPGPESQKREKKENFAQERE